MARAHITIERDFRYDPQRCLDALLALLSKSSCATQRQEVDITQQQNGQEEAPQGWQAVRGASSKEVPGYERQNTIPYTPPEV